MIGVHSAQVIREAEDRFFEENPGADLMQIAARAVSDRAREMAPTGVTLVVVGPGNNGGDGLFAARNLAAAGRPAVAWLVTGQAHPQAVIAARQVGVKFVDSSTAMHMLPDVMLVIDAVLGIGGRPGLFPVVERFATACDDLCIPVLSVDVPSGLSTDEVTPTATSFRAAHTVTFAAPKLCHVGEPAAERCGSVEVIDVGLSLPEPDVRRLDEVDIARWWPWPTAVDDKYSRGVLGIDTGSERYPGAAVLSTTGALNAGTGMIRFVGPERAANLILDAMPSVTIGPGRVEAWLMGCGWGKQDRDAHAARLQAALESGLPAVVDADALEHLPKTVPDGWLLTPHAGELAAMLGVHRRVVEVDPIRHARQAAARWNTAVLLKGATQYVVEPSGRVTIAVPGPAWTAQAGSGDVLAGICGMLLAAGLPAWQAGALGASVQAMAAAHKPGPFPPAVIARTLPEVLGGLWTTLRSRAFVLPVEQ
ncbi:bifunctional ADP-dependent NAD(P)H-hydrate dehydratase/NAD(P)H-hydrate epimerase [Brooklawnia cerclae]|uniref:ADP-dependent (S)-NAD(P)H-hydrate dehydratase n=1 Tax=Brooklawnia cerclae TaxID=349934 RepID=A0ABX0SBW4_9ACTN|nr:NAD(P)H-hydrate epimerase [Brooklawnia cerclae]NIH55880.1 hydroxyethylthiazole kinase-like uncharacterized protein yjeF [Brooklawnia cerclae]